MTIIDKITAACLPAITITKKKQGLSITKAEEEYPLSSTNRALEERISELEMKVTSLQMLLITNKSKARN